MKARGELDEAMRLLKEQEHICLKMGNKTSLAISLGNQANIHHDRGKMDEAMRLNREVEHISRRLGNKECLAGSLVCQGIILVDMGQPRAALPLVEEAYKLATDSGLTSLAQQIKPTLDYVRYTTITC